MFYDMGSFLSYLDRSAAAAKQEARIKEGLKLLEAKEAREAKRKPKATPATK